jgi:predicted HTH transcriptional regulator
VRKENKHTEAIREIVLNMIIHRDYRSASDSIVKIFNDKIEFYNPGRLPDNISIEDLLSNNYKSTPRNKKIAEFFKDLGLIEKYGSGIGRIIKYFKEDNLPLPTFENISDGFQVTVFPDELLNKTKDEKDDATVDTQVGVQDRVQVGVQVEKLLFCVDDNLFTTKEIQKQLDLKQRHKVFINYIQPALQLELIEMTIPDKPNSRLQKYRLTQKGKEAKEKLNTQVRVQVTEQATTQVNTQVGVQDKVQVEKLLFCVDDNLFTTKEIQKQLDLKQRHKVFINYIQPALKLGLIEMTIPDKPNSRLQKYRLTQKGKDVKEKLK